MKLRRRALKFMDALVKKLEENGHSIKFEYQRCHIEMYGQLTEINLRQKYFRKRIKNSSGYSTDTYEISDKLEFQIGSYARKGWIDRKTKSLEDYLPTIYTYVDNDSMWWAELRKRQKIEEEQREAQKRIDEEIAKQKAIEKAKFDKLLLDAENHNTANLIRCYLKAYKENLIKLDLFTPEAEDYIKWANNRGNEIDPLK